MSDLGMKEREFQYHAVKASTDDVKFDRFYEAWQKLKALDPESTKILFDHIIQLERERIQTHGCCLTAGA